MKRITTLNIIADNARSSPLEELTLYYRKQKINQMISKHILCESVAILFTNVVQGTFGLRS